MSVRTINWLSFLILWMLALVGCGQQWPGEGGMAAGKDVANGRTDVLGGVGVVDLDAVARRVGLDGKIHESLRQRQASLQQQLSVIQASHELNLTDAQQELDEQAPQDQISQLNQLQRQADSQEIKARQQAEKVLRQHRRLLVQQFRDMIRPVVNKVATERGLLIVFTRNESVVLSFTPSVDITDAVVARMLDNRPSEALSSNRKTGLDQPH